MSRIVLAVYAMVLFCALPLGAQHRLSASRQASLPLLALPVQNNDSLLARELPRRKPGRPQVFAVSVDVDIDPARDGQWTRQADHDLWQLRVGSPGAKSLNLGFGRCVLPPGAALYLTTKQERFGPFTAADNADHAQLWTPLLRGDELTVEVEVPPGAREELQLHLTTVNHDFEGAIDRISDDCHLDVACGAADGFPQVDEHRDVIRSVAAYTLAGRDLCTGFLVNNTNQDGRPLFITANHCGVTAENAPTLVTYWNFENDTCRPPGTEASGAAGNGKREIFNTGARLLASHSGTDMTLVELDEPVNPRARVFFAGWDATDALPVDGVFTVHHPDLDEKRISFADEPVTRSTVVGNPDPAGKYLRVPQWDVGSTEGGSSGAPLFDPAGRVRGQLFGGRASCTSQEEDMFGWIHLSWTGGGSPATRLRDWLDPCGISGGRLDGLEETDLAAAVVTSRGCAQICGTDTARFEFGVGRAFPATSTVSVSAPAGLWVSAPTTTSGGGTFTIEVAATEGAPARAYPLRLTVSGAGRSDEVSVTVELTRATLSAPPTLAPAPNATEVDPFVRLQWQAVAEAERYEIQYGRYADFRTVIGNLTDLSRTEYIPDFPLPGDTRYYWRVRAVNACGPGSWSEARTFLTRTRTCLLTQGESLPVNISGGDPSESVAELEIPSDLVPTGLEVILGIEHTFLGDLAVRLQAPDGTTIKLFDPLEGGSCPAQNLYVVFADDASLTAEAFGEQCTDGDRNDYLRVRPLEPLAALSRTSAQGKWKLLVEDQAAMDGGAVTDFRLRLCEDRAEDRELAVSLTAPAIQACAEAGGEARLRLDGDFGTQISLRVEADNTELDNYTYTYDAPAGTVTVTFVAWNNAAPGSQELSFTVTAADGTERRAVNTLYLRPAPQPVTPLAARLTPDLILFSWPASVAADRYVLQLSERPDFNTLLDTVVTERRQIGLSRAALPTGFYWRVVSENGCGRVAGPGRSIEEDRLNATHSLAPGQAIAIYPNPTRGAVTVEPQGVAFTGEWQISLFSASGQLLRHYSAEAPSRRNLELGDLPPGQYYLRIAGAFGRITERITRLR